MHRELRLGRSAWTAAEGALDSMLRSLYLDWRQSWWALRRGVIQADMDFFKEIDPLIFNRPVCSSSIRSHYRHFQTNLTMQTFFKEKVQETGFGTYCSGYNLNFKLFWISILIFSILMLSCVYFSRLTSVLWVTALCSVLYRVLGCMKLASDSHEQLENSCTLLSHSLKTQSNLIKFLK